jgi:hypothetical protein
MILTSGELYFIGEFDLKLGQRTDFFKIGIVRHGAKEERTSQDRLLEHQTGNPRRLEVIYKLDCDAVEAIETNLHYRLAPHRVYGEWMRLDEKSLQTAIEEAQFLKEQMVQTVQVFEEAEQLKLQVSKEEKLPPSIDSDIWYAKAQDSKVLSKACELEMEKYKELLTKALDQGEDVSIFITRKQRAGSSKLDEESLKKKHPEIFSKFSVSESKVKGRFLVTLVKEWKNSLDVINPGAGDTLKEFASEVAKAETNGITSALHNLYLGIVSLKAYADWEEELAKTQLRKLCSDFEGITGICTWKRVEQVEEKFNKDLFAQEHPELNAEFTLVSQPITYIRVETRAAYQG